MANPIVETDLAIVLNQINNKLDNLSEGINELKLGQVKLEGKIETLDSKFEQMDKRVGNIEFANRGVFIGMILLVLGGAVKLLGIFP